MNILKSTFDILFSLMQHAEKSMIISIPNLDVEMAEALISFSKDGIDIVLFAEFNEQGYRKGFGEVGALEKLKDSRIRIYDKKNINVYFYIFDDLGFFYFPKSRFEEAEGVSLDLVQMEPSQLNDLKLLFNLPKNDALSFDVVNTSTEPELLRQIRNNIKTPDKKEMDVLIDKLKKDPPPIPDHSRKLTLYQYKFQFVELKFKGANLHIKRVKIPRSALPFRDASLKKDIEANLRLFTDLPEKEFMKPFFDLKENVEVIRSKFLVYLKARDKNLIRRDDKTEFCNELLEIQKIVEDVQASMINVLQSEIKKSREKIKSSLMSFLQQNPLEEFEGLTGPTLLDEIENYTNRIIGNIHFPSAKNILNELKFEYHFYDITWEDLNNQNVLQEMVSKKLLMPGEASAIIEMAIGTVKKQKLK